MRPHLRFILPQGNDYSAILNGSESIPRSDAQLDETKVRSLLSERFGVDTQEFDTAVNFLRNNGYMDGNTLLMTQKARDLMDAIEGDQAASLSQMGFGANVDFPVQPTEQQLAEIEALQDKGYTF